MKAALTTAEHVCTSSQEDGAARERGGCARVTDVPVRTVRPGNRVSPSGPAWRRTSGDGRFLFFFVFFFAPPFVSPVARGSSQHHASGRDAPCAMLNNCPTLLLALTAVAGLLQRCHSWSDEDLLLPPINSSNRLLANLEMDVRFSKRSVDESEGAPDASPLQSLSQCNVSVQRLLPTSLVARWDSSFGFQCDVLIYTTNNHGRAFFSASFNRAISPVVVEHLGVTGGQQELRLCVGCGMSRYRRFGQGRSRGQQSGDQVPFCCVDFSLDELKGDKSWRLNRKPIESTLVACFMTLVIIVWSVAALIWPVPIIAGFLPNGMEQRRPR